MKLEVAFRNFVNTPKTLRSAHTVYLCVSYDLQNKVILFLNSDSIIGSCTGGGVFTARCELNL
jgi:hypothetical protein